MSYVVPPLHIVESRTGGEDDRRGIALHPLVARTGEGRPLVAALKVRVVHVSQRADVGLRNLGPRREPGVTRRVRKTHVPRADVLTHVAAEYPVADLRALRGSE